jgi:hypothetical protein
MSTEAWRPIPGYPGYDASSLGRVRSRRQCRTGKLMRVCVNPQSGYFQVGLRDDGGTQRHRPVHYFVTRAFFGPRPEGMIVRHLDGTRTNNHLSNLMYGTYAENSADRLRHGTMPIGRYLDRDSCVHGHPFTPENTYVQRKARKLTTDASLFPRCRTCDRQQVAARRARERAAAAGYRQDVAA